MLGGEDSSRPPTLEKLVKRRLALVTASLALVGGLLPGALSTANAGPTAGGYTSDNVEYVRNVPFEVGTATGARTFEVKGKKYLMVTSWRSFSIYDLKDPQNPQLVGRPVPFGFKFENEDVATNGRIMLFSESLPQNVLHVWDIQSLENPREIATLPGGAGHTSSCILDCQFSLSSSGTVVDLRRPDQPKVIGKWNEGLPGKSTHDVTEVSPGVVLTSTNPVMLLDFRKSVTKPKLLATADGKDFVHNVQWPQAGKDRFAMAGGETNADTRCNEDSAVWRVLDTKNWQKTKKLTTVAQYEFTNGVFADGAPPVNGLGCSPHWFDTHPTFKDGGLIAMGSYEHGTRFLTVAPKTGAIKETGWFVPWGGSTSASYWITPEIVYNVDYTRGIDILKYTGPLK